MNRIVKLNEGTWLVNRVKSGKTNKQIAAEAGCSVSAVYRTLRRKGYDCNPNIDRSSARDAARHNEFNASWLDSMDAEEKAYAVGFIAADGYINRWGLVIQLHSRDVDILEKLKDLFSATYNLKSHDGGRLVALSLYNVDFVEVLGSKYGLKRAKSRTVPFAEGIPTELVIHYLRGVMDGDGSIGRQARLVTGSRRFYEGFVSWFDLRYGSKLWSAQEGNRYRLVFNRRNADFIHEMYGGAHVVSNRKYALYKRHWIQQLMK